MASGQNELRQYEKSSRPTLLWGSDQSSLIWANEAAARFAGLSSVTALLATDFSKTPFRAQMETCGRNLRTGAQRLDLLRIPVKGRNLSFVGRISQFSSEGKLGLLIIGPETEPQAQETAFPNQNLEEVKAANSETDVNFNGESVQAPPVKKTKSRKSALPAEPMAKPETAIPQQAKLAKKKPRPAKAKAAGKLEPHERESLDTIAKVLSGDLPVDEQFKQDSMSQTDNEATDIAAMTEQLHSVLPAETCGGATKELEEENENAPAKGAQGISTQSPTAQETPKSALALQRDQISKLEDEKSELLGQLENLQRAHDETLYVLDETGAQNQELQAQLHDARVLAAELQTILDTATDGILILDSEGHILNMNHPAEALFNRALTELEGENLLDLLAPESQEAALTYLQRYKADPLARVLNDGCEVLGLSHQGGKVPLYMTLGSLGGEIPGDILCAVLRDITQWKNAEAELTDAKKRAEVISEHKSDFLAKISHEIRTPLNAIIGFSEVMLEERFGPIGSERYKQYLGDIHSSGGYLLSLVNDLLDLSKIESGKLDLVFAPVYLNDLVLQTITLLQPQANRNGIILRSSLQATPPVVADARSIRQIMLNLLSNAVRFTPEGGQIIISTGSTKQNEVSLRVRDTGIGMQHDEIALALEPFRQIGSDQNRARGDGTGLGLPISKALAEANHASFNIESEPEKGTLISVIFPASRVLAEQF